MTAKTLHLGKVLKFLMLDDNKLVSELRRELRAERNKLLTSADKAGGDFYVPFWADAKLHVIGAVNLVSQTDWRVEQSAQRATLYPLLRKGFLAWLAEVSRSTNQKVGWQEGKFHNHIDIDGLELTLKVDNLLALKIGKDQFRLVYPYFAKSPILSEKWARVALWAMAEAFPTVSVVDLEILDVLRGVGFRGANLSLKGDEEFLFKSRYKAILKKWDELRPEYGL